MDVSAQDALAIVNLQNQQYWNLARFNPKRAGSAQMLSGVRWARQKRLWKCRDGFVIFIISSGHMGAPGNKALTEWMASEGMAPEFMKKIDWETFDPQGRELTDEQHRGMLTAIGEFFQRHSKAELYEGSVQKRIILYPCNTTEDLMHDAQLKARGFWTEIAHAGAWPVAHLPASLRGLLGGVLRHQAPRAAGSASTMKRCTWGSLASRRKTWRRLRKKGVI